MPIHTVAVGGFVTNVKNEVLLVENPCWVVCLS